MTTEVKAENLADGRRDVDISAVEQGANNTRNVIKPIVKGALRKLGSSGRLLVNAGATPLQPISIVGKKKPPANEDGYSEFSFLYSFERMAETRDNFFDEEGKFQKNGTKSNSGWVRTLFILNGRALDWIWFPWTFVTLHAVAYAAIDEHLPHFDHDEATSLWQTVFSVALNTTLGFLLVFRLNRAAERFWQARLFWGIVVICVRTLTSALLIHGSHATKNRDAALRWLAAYPLSVKDFMRGEVELNPDGYAGILTDSELLALQRNTHGPMYVGNKIRRHLRAIFAVTEETSPAFAISRIHQLNFMEEQLNRMLEAEGSMERIKGTPLPIVYVSHLRTFLLINLLLLPWIWGDSWGWNTVPIIAIVAFACLSIIFRDKAAEVESPFLKERSNSLDMDGFCKAVLSNILQMLVDYTADDAVEPN